MSTEAEDYLSQCLSLPTILSYLNYDKVVLCMQVNKKINHSINSNWNKMQRKEISLEIEKSRSVENLLTVVIYDRDSHDIFYFGHEWSCSWSCHKKPLLKNLIEKHSLPQSSDVTSLEANLEKKPVDGLMWLLGILLPRVKIDKMKIKMPICSPGKTLTTILESLLEHYSSKHINALLTVSESAYFPIYHEIASAIGANKMKIDCFANKHVLSLSDLETGTMGIVLEECNVDPSKVNTLLQEWKSGQRNVKLLAMKERRVNWQNSWDELCSEMGTKSQIRPIRKDLPITFETLLGRENRQESYFELRRSIDDVILIVSYYQAERYGEFLIEQLM